MPRGQGFETPVRKIRVHDGPWEQFGDGAESLDTDRSAVVRDFIDWFNRVPGAKMPERPKVVRTATDEK